jgi:Zn-dependent protease
VGVLVIIETPGFFLYGVNILFRIAGVIALAFILHELAHKLMAQHYGLWSEFRLNPFGALLSLLTLFSPIKIIAPGAVVIFGSRGTGEKWGKIALAGPLVNIIQLVVFTILSPFYPVLGYAAFLNAELAVFNLLPFSVLDGRKVFTWNKRVWVVVFATAFILGAFLRIRL